MQDQRLDSMFLFTLQSTACHFNEVDTGTGAQPGFF